MSLASFSIGGALRQERLRQNLSLDDIARETKISARFLQAIEAEDFDRLPGVVFTRNFVRQYAEAIHMDADTLLAELPRPNLESAPMPDPPWRFRESWWDPRWNSAITSIAWLTLAAGVAVWTYIHFNRPPQIRAEKAETSQTAAVPSPEAKTEVIPAPAVTPPSDPAGARPEAAPPVAAPRAEEKKPDEKKAGAFPGSAPTAASPVQVVLTARETSWVQVTADGKPAFTGTMKPSDSRSVGANELIRIVTGNAGGLDISLNGRQLDSIGPSGQVRSVRLTAEGLQSPLKTPPSDPL